MNRNRVAPTHLKHKPIYAINNYDKFDGPNKNDTDVHAISIGKAQWNSSKVIPSVKVWRKKNGRWSRQSEETTITRALDMAMLVVKVLDNYYNDKELTPIRSGSDTLKIDTMQDDPSIMKEFNDYLDNNKDDINEYIELVHNALVSYLK